MSDPIVLTEEQKAQCWQIFKDMKGEAQAVDEGMRKGIEIGMEIGAALGHPSDKLPAAHLNDGLEAAKSITMFGRTFSEFSRNDLITLTITAYKQLEAERQANVRTREFMFHLAPHASEPTVTEEGKPT